MKLENVDALKTWLMKSLSPICDADTNKLATYIIALLKKELPETNLRTVCKDQLQVFLEDKTEAFVDNVFKEITQNKTYLNENSNNNNNTTNPIDTQNDQLKTAKKLRSSPSHKRRTSRHKHRRRGSYSGSSSDVSRSRSRSKSNSSNSSRSRSRSRSPNNDESSSWRGARTSSTTDDKSTGNQSHQQIPQMYQPMNNYQQNKRDGPNKRHFPVAQNYYQQRPTMIMPRTQNRPRSLISITPHEDNNQTQGSESTNQIEPGKGIKRHFNSQRQLNQAQQSQQTPDKADISKQSTLIIRKIPKELNTETKLHEHFDQFGTVNNIIVNFDGLQDAALVQYSTQKEAQSAIKCPQPVFNNRFIRLFWFNTYKRQETSGQTHQQHQTTSQIDETKDEPATKKPVKERLGFVSQEQSNEPLGQQQGVNKENNVNLNPASLKLVLNQPTTQETSILTEQHQPPTIDLKKLKLIKKQQDETQKKAIQIKIELREKTQKFIEENINQAKILFNKISQCKTDEEKGDYLQTIKQINIMIEKQKENLLKIDAELMKMKNPSSHKQHHQQQQLVASNVADTVSSKDETKVKKFPPKQIYAPQKAQVSVDHRPKKLLISNIQSNEEKLGIIKHMRLFGAIETFEATNENELVFDFLSRKESEIALAKGSVYKSKPLTITWYKDESKKETGKIDQFNSKNVTDDVQENLNETLANEDEHEDVKDDSLIAKLIEEDEDDQDENESSRPWRS